MKERILKLIASGCRQDGIEIAYSLGEAIDKIYACLQELEVEGKIKKVYIGLNTYYELI